MPLESPICKLQRRARNSKENLLRQASKQGLSFCFLSKSLLDSWLSILFTISFVKFLKKYNNLTVILLDSIISQYKAIKNELSLEDYAKLLSADLPK